MGETVAARGGRAARWEITSSERWRQVVAGLAGTSKARASASASWPHDDSRAITAGRRDRPARSFVGPAAVSTGRVGGWSRRSSGRRRIAGPPGRVRSPEGDRSRHDSRPARSGAKAPAATLDRARQEPMTDPKDSFQRSR